MSATRTIVRRSLLGLGVIVAVPVLFTGLNVAILLATDDRIPVSHWKSAESRSRFERRTPKRCGCCPSRA